MTIFDLLFIGIVLASLATLGAAAACAWAGRRRLAGRLLAAWGAGLALYVGIVAIVGLASPPRVLAPGEDRCYDDWCIAVEGATWADARVTVTLRLSSRARRVTQREFGIAVYLLDEAGRRFDAEPAAAATPFDVVLPPGAAVRATRTFDASGAAGRLALAIAHEGSRRFPGAVIIGDDSSLLHQPTLARLPE